MRAGERIDERCPSLSLSRCDDILRPIRGTPNDRWKLPALAVARATRPNACSTCGGFMAASSSRAGSSFPFLLPRSSPRPLVYDRRRAASSSIGDGLMFLLSITLSTTSRLFTLSMYTCVHTHIHTHARFHAYTIHTCGVVSAGTTLGHPRRTLRGRENIQGRSLRFSSPHGTSVFFSHAASSLARSQREKSLSEPPVLPTPRASTRKRSTTYRFAGSRRLDIVGDNTTTTALAFIAQYFPRKSFTERKRYNLGKSILCIFYVVEAGKRIYINSSLISCFYNDLKIAAVFETKNND